MKAFIARCLLVLAFVGPLSSILACTPPPTIVTQPGRTAFTADQIAVQVGHLEQAVIQANTATPKGIPDATAIAIVKWCVATEATLGATPMGWQATVAAGWKALKASLPPADLSNPIIGAVIAGVDAALAAWS